MLFWTIVRVAIASLWANRLRSILSMLGVIIGVGAVIAMLAVGEGAQKRILDQVTSMGANLLIVRAGEAGRHGVASGSSVESLTVEDAEAILAGVDKVARLTPAVQTSGQFKFKNKNSRTSILGAAPTYFEIRNYVVEKGRSFTDGEVGRRSRVAVLGATTAANLFGDANPVGVTIRIDGIDFLVVGVLKAKGSGGGMGGDPDDVAVVPYTTAMRRLMGVRFLREIDVQIEPTADQTQVQVAVETLLRKRHRIRPGGTDDFNVRNVAEMVETAASVTRTFTILLAAVATISLVVGGIGIMNIMLVTVTERTREIGIRKAIGAKNGDVLRQFLLEAVTMSCLGGIIGAGLGVGTAEVVARVTSFQTLVETRAVLVSLGFAAAVGIFFGWYPARRAANLDPIECLRYE